MWQENSTKMKSFKKIKNKKKLRYAIYGAFLPICINTVIALIFNNYVQSLNPGFPLIPIGLLIGILICPITAILMSCYAPDISRRATESDWDIKPMPDENKIFELNRKFTKSEIEILKTGHIPNEMEDKWFWYCSENKLYAHRTLTGYCVYIIEFNHKTNVHTVTVNACPKQHIVKDLEKEANFLNGLLNWWTQLVYDYYHEFLWEIAYSIKND